MSGGEREPKRIQRKRTKGWRLPEGAVYVGRPTKWGNPYGRPHPVTGEVPDPTKAVRCYRGWLFWEQPQPRLVMRDPPRITEIIRDLRGKTLACWCPLNQHCHADVLLELANTPTRPKETTDE